MGTRGLYGFRKNGIDKTAYNHWDSYPSCLGKTMVDFCQKYTVQELNELFDSIIMVLESGKPTEEQIEVCKKLGWYNPSVGNRRPDDWYCLIREVQGEPDKLMKAMKAGIYPYMIDSNNFILDSLFCEFAYIVNLDTGMLEFYVGFQRDPQEGNRYGTTPNEDGYYPCKLVGEYPLNDLGNAMIEMEKFG